MKFITEYDLRSQFNAQPFTHYQLEEGARLTPGARTFLSDRGINLLADGTEIRFGQPAENLEKMEEKEAQVQASPAQASAANADIPTIHHSPARPGGTEKWEDSAGIIRSAQTARGDPLAEAKLKARLGVVEAEFLTATSRIIKEDIETAQRISELGRAVRSIGEILDGDRTKINIPFADCGGMNHENCESDNGDCFMLTDFYLQLPTAETLVLLNSLRAEMRLLGVEAEGAVEAAAKKITILGAIDQIINSISQLICKTAGVKECRRNQ